MRIKTYNSFTLLALTLFAACLWPFMNFASENIMLLPGYSSMELLQAVLFVMFIWGAGMLMALILGWRREVIWQRCMVVLAVLAVQAFTFKAMRDAITLTGVQVSASWLTLIATGVVALVLWHLSRHEKIRTILIVFVLVGSFIAFGRLGIAAIMATQSRTAAIGEEGSASDQHETLQLIEKRNVFYIIVDSYSDSHVLSKLGYDNSSFLQSMRERGFEEMPRGRSNYFMTHLTLMGILDMSYPADVDTKPYKNYESFYPDALNDGHLPDAVRIFSESGYQLRRFSSPWDGCDSNFTCYLRPASMWRPGRVLEAFLTPTNLPFIYSKIGQAEESALQRLLGVLPEIIFDGPNFVFLHNIAPHPPAKFDDACEPIRAEEISQTDWRIEDRPRYFGAIECVNQLVDSAVDRILSLDSDAIIVVQADHGSLFNVQRMAVPAQEWSFEALEERGSFINLIRAPDHCNRWLYEGISQINTMRFVIGCLSGKAPDYLPDQSFRSNYSDAGASVGLYELNRE